MVGTGTVALIGVYLGAYVYARMTHRIVRLQNRAGGEQLVMAKPDPWDDILLGMSVGKPLDEACAHAQKGVPAFLNMVFWPLRSIEAAWWNRDHG